MEPLRWTVHGDYIEIEMNTNDSTPSWILAPPESLSPITGAPTSMAWSIIYNKIKWVNGCCLTPIEQFFSNIMTRTSYFSMRWRWCLLSWIFIVLAHWFKSPQGDILINLDTLSWFWANQSFFLLFNAACLVEKLQIPIK